MRTPSIPARPTACFLGLALLLVGASAVRASDQPAERTARWYEQLLDGDKAGHLRVVWSPSTWDGRKTIHDTTTIVSRTARDMAGQRDIFEVTTTLDLERGADGTLWWMRVRSEEPERTTVTETTWKDGEKGSGYEYTVTIVGQEDSRQLVWIPLEEPVMVDAEAFLGARARAGKLAEGDTFDVRHLDVRKRGFSLTRVTIVGEEQVADEHGEQVPTWRVVERDPESGHESTMWLDREGAFVQIRNGSSVIRRATEEKAGVMPMRPAGYSITIPSTPRLERIFSADRVLLDVYIRADEHRKLPVFPTSPWSRVLEMRGDDEHGHVAKVELRSYDDPAAKARIPLVDERFARALEPTALMQTRHPLVLQTVRDVVGGEKDARAAATKLARFVYTKLAKRSGGVAQADAVQILQDCQGDCSEHCLLFVTLCRAAGIPARRCSGYVCIGGMWGSHAWCEIWTGAWIGADPTTGEVGTGARYLFFGYPDEPGSFPGVVSSRVRGRLRIVATRLEEDEAVFDLTRLDEHRIYDRKGRRYLHALAGIEARDVPEGWTVRMSGDQLMMIFGPGFTAQIAAAADQGADMDSVARYVRGTRTTFAGVPAMVRASGSTRVFWIFSRRRRVQVLFGGKSDEALAELERVLAPTFADPVLPWHAEAAGEPAEKPAEKPAKEPAKEPVAPDK